MARPVGRLGSLDGLGGELFDHRVVPLQGRRRPAVTGVGLGIRSLCRPSLGTDGQQYAASVEGRGALARVVGNSRQPSVLAADAETHLLELARARQRRPRVDQRSDQDLGALGFEPRCVARGAVGLDGEPHQRHRHAPHCPPHRATRWSRSRHDILLGVDAQVLVAPGPDGDRLVALDRDREIRNLIEVE